MSLDLFFHPRKSDFASVRAPDFVPTPAQQRARRKLIDALLVRYPGCTLGGDIERGWLQEFPHGELSWFPGYLYLSVHGHPDPEVLHAFVDALEADGLVCFDPQDAGFATGSPARIESFDGLIGSRFVGIRLLRDWVSGIALELAWDGDEDDGRVAQLEFAHALGCTLPDPMKLLKARVTRVDPEGPFNQIECFDYLDLHFDNGVVLAVRGCVYHKGTISPPRRRRR